MNVKHFLLKPVIMGLAGGVFLWQIEIEEKEEGAAADVFL